MSELAKIFVIAGLILIGFGLLLKFKFFGLGQLPGDILLKKGNLTFYFPLVTSILLSLIITLIFLFLKK